MAYNPSDHKVINQPFGMGAIPLNSKSLFFDVSLQKYRYFQNVAEVNAYFANLTFRDPTFDVIVNTGGTLAAGVITGGVNDVYWFRDGVNLVKKDTDLSAYYTKTQIDAFLLAINQSISDLESDIIEHVSNVSNPHQVTKTQVGLGNVDNTSDLNKPISIATQAAITSEANIRAAADDLKADTAYVDDQDATLSNAIISETNRALAVEETKADKISITQGLSIDYAGLDVSKQTYTNIDYANKTVQLVDKTSGTWFENMTFSASGVLTLGFTADPAFSGYIFGTMGDLNNYISKASTIDETSSLDLFDVANVVVGQTILSNGVLDPSATSTVTPIIPVSEGMTITASNINIVVGASKRAAYIKQDGSRITAGTITTSTFRWVVPASVSPIIGLQFKIAETTAPSNESPATYENLTIYRGNSPGDKQPFEKSDSMIDSKPIIASYFKDENGIIQKTRNQSGIMQIAYIGDDLHVRCHYNDTEDLVHKGQMNNENNIFNYVQARVILKTEDILATGREINTGGDNVAPMQYIDFGNISGNHGYEAAQSVGAAHGKTSADVTAIYQAPSGDQFYLTEVTNSTTLVFFGCPKSVADGTGVSIIPPSGTVLTWVSGGVSTTPITLGTLSTVQKYPSTLNVKRVLEVSGREVDDQGYYWSDSIKVVNSYGVGDPATMINESPFLYRTAGYLNFFNITYEFNPSGIVTMTPSFTNEQNKAVVNFGIIQDQELPFSGYPARYLYGPRIATSDYATLKDTTVRPVVTTRLNNSNMVDPTKPAHMHIQFVGNSRTDLRIGHPVGYNFLNGIGKDSERVNNSEVLYLNTNNKLYLRLFAGTATVGRMSLQRIMWATAYYGYFDPQVNPYLTACFDYRFGKKNLLYIHAHQELVKQKVVVPQYLNGMKIESIADSNGNMTLITDDYVPSGGLYINNTGHGYLILLLS